MVEPGSDIAGLRAELETWASSGLRARLWIRDDDLNRASKRFDAMTSSLERLARSALLSIIPDAMDKSLPRLLGSRPCYVPCQHGLAHKNHEPAELPKAEFGRSRPTADSIADVERGRNILAGELGDMLLPVFVPPWNRIADDVQAALPDLGLVGVSSYTGELLRTVPGVVNVNADIDVLNWAEPNDGGVSVQPLGVLTQRLTDILRLQRETGSYTPIGLLTHHRAMNEEAWRVFETLLRELMSSGIADWPHPASLFGLRSAMPFLIASDKHA